MYFLGISAWYHDSAAAIIKDGEVIAAAQEERFTRIKHDPGFPIQAIRYCLDEAGLGLNDLEAVVFFEKPYRKFSRILGTFSSLSPDGFESFQQAIPLWMGGKLYQDKIIRQELSVLDRSWRGELLFSEHHLSHAASAFYPSPFDEALVLTMDGVGEWATTSVSIGKGASLDIVRELHFPHSLGMLYAAFTYHTGFKVNSGEYKVMGLAPYGSPKYTDLIFQNLVDLKEDGSFWLNQEYFDYTRGFRMTNDRFANLFGVPIRQPEQLLNQDHLDLAASIQVATEKIVLQMTRSLAREFGQKRLCLAGGVALNCVANGKILRDGAFDEIWIQPAAGDAGGALGAALYAYHGYKGQPRRPPDGRDRMKGAYLGPKFDQKDIETRLSAAGARFSVHSEDEVIELAAKALASEQAVGWFQGRMEFGPRALGGRSILGDPRSPRMQKLLNLKVKYRESFRPFAPSVLREDVAEWFDLDGDSPYMLLVADVKPEHRRLMTDEEQALFGIDKLNVVRSDLPAVTHIDYSARIQTVDASTNPRYHALISEFKNLTGCGVVVNTSFNVRGEPIVCTPEDAFRCLMGTEIDLLIIGNCIMHAANQDASLKISYKDAFELD